MSQSLSNLLVHSIFSTKNRYPFIDSTLAPQLYAYLTTTFASHGSFVHKIGGVEDHMHIFATLPRTMSVSDLLATAKMHSSKWVKNRGAQYEKFSWQKGFAVFSVSGSQADVVCKYIDNQHEHHKKHSFQDEYREFLRLNNVEFDERYVWD